MKLKRNSIAFLVMVFILSGCMSEVAVPQNNLLQNNESTIQSDIAAGSSRSQLVSKQYEGVGGMKWMSTKLDGTSMKEEIQAYTNNESQSRDTSKTALMSSLQKIADSSDVDNYKVEEKKVEPVQASNVMYPRMTFYGVDCNGCNLRDGRGNTATGVGLSINEGEGVLQSNGAWLPGITYDGYYIVAADKSIPMYSIIQITNHGITGKGITPDTPIQAIVLDRGGGVNGAHLDLYIGSESHLSQFSRARVQPVAEIIRYGR